MDLVASQILDDMFIGEYNQYYDQYGKSKYSKMINPMTIDFTKEVKEVFLEWYGKEKHQNFFFESLNNKGGKLIIQHVIFRTMFLKYLVNCHINYRKS